VAPFARIPYQASPFRVARIQEGRHRITDLRDARVRRTVLVRLELVEAADDPR